MPRTGPGGRGPRLYAVMADYLALIIAYKRPDLIEAVLAQLEAQRERPRAVVIVDNGGDLPAGVGGDAGFPVEVVPRPDNPGYAVAVNLAQERLHAGERLLVLTHDAVFGPELAERLRAVLDADSAIGAAGPVLMRASRPGEVFSAGGRLTPGGRALHTTRLPEPIDADAALEVDWIDGAIIMYAPDALDAVGWVSEDYFLYFEDVDTAWRMRRAGYRTVVATGATAEQEPGAHPTYLGIRNMTLFARTAGIPPVRAAFAVARRVAEESAVAVLQRRLPPLRAAYRGWRDGRRGLRGKPAR